MNRRLDSHIFWGFHSPLSAISGAGLIIMASGRFAFALVAAAALLWVYGLSALIFSAARKLMPPSTRGRMIILLFLAAFLGGIFTLFTGLVNPLLIMGMGFVLILVPPCCLGSGFFEASDKEYPAELVSRALLEAGVLAGIILAFALIREPLGLGVLSFPGGAGGITELFKNSNGDGFVPAGLLSASSGAFILLGYGIALFRFLRERYGSVPEEDQ